MVGSSNKLRKIGGKLAVKTCYVLTADVTIDSFVFKRSISRKLLIIKEIIQNKNSDLVYINVNNVNESN